MAAPSPVAGALKANGERVPSCSWNRPGHDPFVGDVVAAIDRYPDLPPDVRRRLKERMATREYDDLVTIRRDSIEGAYRYAPGISDMHFGRGRVCSEVTRAQWSPAMQERGLVYCESGHCILVPTVCRNVSRIARGPTAVASETAEALPADDGAGSRVGALGAPSPESFEELLAADPTGAGPALPLGGVEGGPPFGLPFPPVPPLPPPLPGGGVAAPVPEPGTWVLLSLGLLGLAWRQRLQRRAGVPRCATQKR